MSNIKKSPYEISVWEDYYEGSSLKERKVVVIGSDTMTSQSRALNPKLVSNVNGTNTFTFSMYYRYKDTETGEMVDNKLVTYLTNETKVKLSYKGKWYDFIVKNITENSDNYSFSYTLTDAFINELSKTGFEITLATELENNCDTITNLAGKVLENTDWAVGPSDTIAQIDKELVIAFIVNNGGNGISAKSLVKNSNGAVEVSTTTDSIPDGSLIYGFYSCCAGKTSRFQFIYLEEETPQIDSERVILNGTQYLYEGAEYTDSAEYGFGIPNFTVISGDPLNNGYRGERFVFTQKSHRDKLLDRIVKEYTKDNKTYLGYVDTTYPTPNILTDYISNGTEIKSTTGWRTGWYGTGEVDKRKIPRVDAITAPSVIDLLNNDQPLAGKTYRPILKLDYTQDQQGSGNNVNDTHIHYVVVNSGFTDAKRSIKSIQKDEKFVCYCSFVSVDGEHNVTSDAVGKISIKVVKLDGYSATTKEYAFNNNGILLEFSNGFNPVSTSNPEFDGCYFGVADAQNSIDEATFKKSTTKIAVIIEHTNNDELFYLKSFQIFRYYESEGSIIYPHNQDIEAKVVNTYCYYEADQEITSADQIIYDAKSNAPLPEYVPIYTEGCAKQKIVTASQSNRFNIIQSLCESFECWASFEINHDTAGNIIPFAQGVDNGKRVCFHNYIGQDNPVDFRYGVNVKSIQRTVDSKQLVSKLIVKANSNQYAPNGMCTIARAPANPTGETTIYNFDYYVNQGMLDATELENDLYKIGDSRYIGYYTTLGSINRELRELSEKLASIQGPLAQARADVQVCEAGKDAASDKFTELDDTLFCGYGIYYQDCIDPEIDPELYEKIKGDKKLADYVVKGGQYTQAMEDYRSKLEDAERQLARYEEKKTDLEGRIEILTAAKSELNTLFFKKYARFIQEGSWNDESYTDENLYFYDAQAVGYESSVPAVTYSISLIDVSPLEGYERYEYQLGDRAYIQDTEFFGYVSIDGIKTPAREEIVVTEITYSLDQPETNSFKVQTYKNQFQDLFRRMSATVQQVKLTTGAYNRAAELAKADTAHRLAYMQDALNDAATVLENKADQSVVWDNTGITVTSVLNRAQVLRIVNDGILMSTDGGETWQLGITPNGISANKITSGQIDTSLLQIMNGNEAYFRWDIYGITAYDFTLNLGNEEYPYNLNSTSGVRFDRFGIYSFTGVDGTNWHPKSIDGPDAADPREDPIRKYSIFDLTNEGLHINLGKGTFTKAGRSDTIPHASESFLGRTNGLIYNKWNGQTPIWDNNLTDVIPFVKVMSITNNNTEQFALYDDGTLFAQKANISGKITAESGEVGGFTVDATKLYASYNPSSGITRYVGLQSNDGTSTTKLIFAGATYNTGAGAVFYVRQDGYLYSTKGQIGGFYLSSTGLTSQGYTVTRTVLNPISGEYINASYIVSCQIDNPSGSETTPDRIGGYFITREYPRPIPQSSLLIRRLFLDDHGLLAMGLSQNEANRRHIIIPVNNIILATRDVSDPNEIKQPITAEDYFTDGTWLQILSGRIDIGSGEGTALIRFGKSPFNNDNKKGVYIRKRNGTSWGSWYDLTGAIGAIETISQKIATPDLLRVLLQLRLTTTEDIIGYEVATQSQINEWNLHNW